jgi:tRNA threonylcarbamoyladenosine biosynthesis protein TsaB
MSLILGISTSSPLFEVIIGDDSQVLFSSTFTLSLRDTRDISQLVSEVLDNKGITPNDISSIMVDIGPGGTSLVRTGVAFANAFGYSLGIPVCPVPSVELIGLEAWEQYQLPVICTVKSIKEYAYVALYDGKLVTLKYGILADVVKEMTAEMEEFVIAGVHREQVIALLPDKKIHDSGLQFGQAKYLIEKKALFEHKYVSFPLFAHPITEQSAYLYA